MTVPPLFNEDPSRTLSEFEFLQDPNDKRSRLGIGSFATVKLCREKATKKLVALKMITIDPAKTKPSDLHNLRIEIVVHNKIEHPNIIGYHGYAQRENKVFVVLEYAEKGNLYSYLHKGKSLTQQEIFRFFYQTCQAIHYLHQEDIMHRDIKPENLLLDKRMNIKLCDFGWCGERIKEKRTTFCGTYEYMAPEVVYKKPYDYRIDIWSLGVLLYELIHKEAPYKGRTLPEICESLKNESIIFSSTIDTQAKDLILKILKVNPNERLSLPQILAHPWVRKQLGSMIGLDDLLNDKHELTDKENKEEKFAVQGQSEKSSSGKERFFFTKAAKGFISNSIAGTNLESDGQALQEQKTNQSTTKTRSNLSHSITKIITERSNIDENKSSGNLIKKRRIAENSLENPKKAFRRILSPNTPSLQLDQDTASYISATSATLPNTGKVSLKGLLVGVPSSVKSISAGIDAAESSNPSRAFTKLVQITTKNKSQTPTIPQALESMQMNNVPKTLKSFVTPRTPNSSRAGNSISTHRTLNAPKTSKHNKNLTFISESHGSHRTLTEHQYNTSTNNLLSKETQVNRNMPSSKQFDLSKSNYEKEISNTIGSLVSPVIWSNRRVVKRNLGKSEVNFREVDMVIQLHNQESNLMKQTLESQVTVEDEPSFGGVNFGKFIRGNYHQRRLAFKGIDNDKICNTLDGFKKEKLISKENNSERVKSIKSLTSLDKAFTPRDKYLKGYN